jgi:hypothetical protein
MSRVRIGVKEADADGQDGRLDCTSAGFGLYSGSRNYLANAYTPSVYSMKQSPEHPLHRLHAFLRRLRAGGRSNMYGAVPYLMRRFDLDRDTAFRVICDWVDAQDAAELVGAAARVLPARLPERTPPASKVSRKRSRARG